MFAQLGRTALSLSFLAMATTAIAEPAQAPHVSIELNALDAVEGACRISFVIQNGFEADIDRAVYEAVLFDTDGRVAQMTLFDFGALPASRPRVRQFAVPGLACTSVARLLINGTETCEGTGLPDNACSADLALTSRTNVEVAG